MSRIRLRPQRSGVNLGSARSAPTADSGRCAWCGARLDAGAERRPGRASCRECDAWTTTPAPSSEELDRAYEGWYRPATGRFAGIGDTLLRRLRARLARRLDRVAPAGPILDVGAGDGTLVDALETCGRQAVGIDRHPSHPVVREVEIDAVEEGPWSAIVFWHSLEHLPAAGEALEQATALLRPGGVMVIAMPNAASIQAAVFGDRWFALDLPRHLVHVPAPALLARLDRLGLAIERVSHLRGGQVVFGWLHGFVGRLPGRPNLYDAIRRREAREAPLSKADRVVALAAAALLLPFAVVCALLEASLKRGGAVYVEARRV